MKIEQKHGSVKPVYAAGVSLLAAATLLGGCDNGLQYSGDMVVSTGDGTTTTTTEEVMIDGDVIEFTDDISCESNCTDEYGFDFEQAAKELDEYCGKFPTCLRMDSSQFPEQNILFDVTGDGTEDLVTSFTFGSGIVRNTIVVYDAINKQFYSFYAQYDSYSFCGIEDGRILAEETVYPDKKTKGTVEISDGWLVFVPAEK